ncbi:hypothetical protein F5Y18DRAFT_98882 [Xylariaceae sp. FL1019]|nr:hypothetical protein F5Y18DRAFT_98882 [Xylariaceae sp. FL1019]
MQLADLLVQHDTLRCFHLVFLSLLCLPISLTIVCVCLCYQRYIGTGETSVNDASPRQTVLVTGVGMAKGLTLARAFYSSGHRVIGADAEDGISPCAGRFSRSLSVFYKLRRPLSSEDPKIYVDRLVRIVKAEKVDLWVSCSAVTSALDDARAKAAIEEQTKCKCIQFDVPTTSMLDEKYEFMRACQQRSLPVPETHFVASQNDVSRILSASMTARSDRRYILKPVGVDDVNRGNMTLLPLPSQQQTLDHISRLPITHSKPWILQQFIAGNEYCTHALVVRGEVRCFVACPSAEMLMHYKPLSPDSWLWKAMLQFTVDFVDRSLHCRQMTGHLSFDFIAEHGEIYAIECNPRAHTAVVLFGGQSNESQKMVQEYLAATTNTELQDGLAKGSSPEESGNDMSSLVIPAAKTQPRYWIGHDLVSFLYLLFGGTGIKHCIAELSTLIVHIATWKEGTFETWDPLPAFVLYQIYWPLTIISAWWNGRRWSRVNVSTTKMFAC